jgi:lysophosphatidylglycerol acyltransferase 1
MLEIISQGKENREKSLLKFMKHLRTVFTQKSRKYLVLFPEGGFLRKRKDASKR